MFEGFTILDEENEENKENTHKRKRNEQILKESKKIKVEDEKVQEINKYLKEFVVVYYILSRMHWALSISPILS